MGSNLQHTASDALYRAPTSTNNSATRSWIILGSSYQDIIRWRGEQEVLTCRSRPEFRLGRPSFSHSFSSTFPDSFSSAPHQIENHEQTSSIEEKTHRPFCITALTKPLGNSPSACSSKSDFFIVNANPPFSWYMSVMPGKLWILESSRERLYMSPTFSL